MIPDGWNWHSALELAITATLLALLVWLAFARRRDARHSRRLLEQQAARHQAIIESASDAVISADHEGRILVFNRSAELLLGCPRSEAIGQAVERFVPEPLRERHAAGMAAFARSAQPAVAMGRGRDVVALRADGSEVEVEAAVSKTAEPGSGGRRSLYTVVLRDVSERRAAERELYRVTERYRMVVEQSPDAIWLAEEGGRLLLVNPACVALLGAPSAAALVGRSLTEFLPAWPLPGVGPTQEFAVRRVDGCERVVELSLAEVPDHGGGAVQGVMHDVTERRRREGELRRTQTALLQAQEIARLGYFEYDAATRQWTVSPSLARMHGLTENALHSDEEGLQLVHPEDREALAHHLLQQVMQERRPADIEYRIVRPSDGQTRWAHAIGRAETTAEDGPPRLFVTVQDVTDRKLASLALERSREELRRLSASLTSAREAERRHVARELHDELGQRLSVLKLDLRTLLSAADAAPDSALARQVQAIGAAVDDAIAATRRIAADLRPAMLDDLGLTAALEWLADGWSRRTGVAIALELDAIDGTLNEAAAITVYRIVQEALTNVARHAGARQVTVALRREGDAFSVVVQDDGRGLAPGDTDKRGPSGLAGMRERARLLGGTAEVRNAPEGGCRLEVRLPLERVDSEHGLPQEMA